MPLSFLGPGEGHREGSQFECRVLKRIDWMPGCLMPTLEFVEAADKLSLVQGMADGAADLTPVLQYCTRLAYVHEKERSRLHMMPTFHNFF